VPSFESHICQAKRNLAFLEKINVSASDHFDWQVTTCFYTAVHLVNAYLSLHGLQYRKHVDVKNAINPYSKDAIDANSAFPEDIFVSYKTLEALSRRSRYLVNLKDGQLHNDIEAALTHEIHFAKSLRHLNKIIKYMIKGNHFTCPKISLNCDGIKAGELIFKK
jgi:hypothetical protein